jgi:hypothetical protein
MRAIRIMSVRMVTQIILVVGRPMAMGIVAREVDNEMTMAMATTTCSVGVVAISKTNFMPGARVTAAGVNTNVSVRRAHGGNMGVQEYWPIWEGNLPNSWKGS